MSQPNAVIFIDDQPDRIEYFVEALRDEGFAVEVIQDVNEAVNYFSQPRPEVLAAVVDVIMPPGRFRHEDHRDGTRTGVFLYAEICKRQAVFRAAGRPLPLAVLTQVTDAETHRLLEELQIQNHPGEKYMTWSKVGLEAEDFANEFKTWIEALRELTRIGQKPTPTPPPPPSER